MKEERQPIKRIAAALLIILGVVLGGTWGGDRFCFGDRVFLAAGLPAWSGGTSGTHYPAIAGMVMILIGIGILNSTLSKRERLWIGGGAVLIILVVGLAACM